MIVCATVAAVVVALVRRKAKKANELQSCVLWGESEAFMGQPRCAPLGWDQASQRAWYDGYDSVAGEQYANAA